MSEFPEHDKLVLVTKDEAIAAFRKAFRSRFGHAALFDHCPREDDDELVERITVSVSTGEHDWSTVEPKIEALLRETGADEFFEIGGAGLGRGWRDVSIYRKKTQ